MGVGEGGSGWLGEGVGEWMCGCRRRWSGWVGVWEWGARIGRKPNLTEPQ